MSTPQGTALAAQLLTVIVLVLLSALEVRDHYAKTRAKPNAEWMETRVLFGAQMPDAGRTEGAEAGTPPDSSREWRSPSLDAGFWLGTSAQMLVQSINDDWGWTRPNRVSFDGREVDGGIELGCMNGTTPRVHFGHSDYFPGGAWFLTCRPLR